MLAGYGEQVFFERPGVVPECLAAKRAACRLCSTTSSSFVSFGAWSTSCPSTRWTADRSPAKSCLKLKPRDGIRQSLLLSIVAAGAMAAFGLFSGRLGSSPSSSAISPTPATPRCKPTAAAIRGDDLCMRARLADSRDPRGSMILSATKSSLRTC